MVMLTRSHPILSIINVVIPLSGRFEALIRLSRRPELLCTEIVLPATQLQITTTDHIVLIVAAIGFCLVVYHHI